VTDYDHYWQLITLAPSLQRLARMASLAVEADLGTRQRGRRGPAVVFDVRYRIETIPARYARVMRQPRMRLYDLESAEVSKVSRLLSWDGDIAEVAWYVESLLRDRQVQQISRKLEEAAGTSVSGIAASFGPLLQELAATEPPSATELPFGGELSYILGDARSLAAKFIDEREHRDYPVSEEDANKRVMRQIEAEGAAIATAWPAWLTRYASGSSPWCWRRHAARTGRSWGWPIPPRQPTGGWAGTGACWSTHGRC
jgi:hypothetical protein